jgi:hypothetical protein
MTLTSALYAYPEPSNCCLKLKNDPSGFCQFLPDFGAKMLLVIRFSIFKEQFLSSEKGLESWNCFH